MFEALLAICLAGAPDVCRDTLLPGYEAADRAVCERMLAEKPPAPDLSGEPFCAPAGPALDFSEVAQGVFVHRGIIAEPDMENGGDVANIGFVVGGDAVAVIDAGSARWIAEGVWRAIRQKTDLPVRYLVLTHIHPDHVLGAPFFADAGAEIIAHAGFDRAIGDRAANYEESLGRLIGEQRFIGSAAPRADVTVDETMTLDLGGRRLALRSWPRSHTGTDLTVLDQKTGILFAGDLIFDEHTPALDGSLRGWQAVVDEMAAMDLAGVVPGHGGPLLDWPEGLRAMARYLAVLADETRAAIDDGMRIAEAAETVAGSEAGNWALFEAYNPRNATVAFTELEWE